MTQPSELAINILRDLNIAVLRRKSAGDYEFIGHAPDFYQEFFSDEEGKPSCEPWRISAMLDFFIQDAELFFSNNAKGHLHSGLWQEEALLTGSQALNATAMTCEGEQLLVLRLLGEEFVDRSRILQKARENLLERRELHNDIATYKHRASYDKLTGLCNRSHFDEALDCELSHALAQGSDLSLLMIDIDNFKSINDRHGHLAGDAVLAQLGGELKMYVRQGDVACRYGGEEFAILAPMTGQHQAMLMAEKLRRGIAEYTFGDLDQQITISIGCAAYRKGESPSCFINRADLALYDAKKSGKNLVRMR